MPNYDALAEEISQIGSDMSSTLSGELGYDLGGSIGFKVVDPDNPRNFLVRFVNGNFVSARHSGKIPQKPGYPVLIGYDNLGKPFIIGPDPTKAPSFLSDDNAGSNIGYHTHVRDGGMDFPIDSWEIKYLRVTANSGLVVSISSGMFFWNGAVHYLNENTLNLTAFYASLTSAYYQRWVVVGIDPVAGTFVAIAGDEILSTTKADRSRIALIPFYELGYIPLAAVWIQGGDTLIPNYRIEDMRYLPGSIIWYLANLYNVNDSYEYDDYSLVFNDGYWDGYPVEAAGGGAGGAPTSALYVVGQTHADLTNEIVIPSLRAHADIVGFGGGGFEVEYNSTSDVPATSSAAADVLDADTTIPSHLYIEFSESTDRFHYDSWSPAGAFEVWAKISVGEDFSSADYAGIGLYIGNSDNSLFISAQFYRSSLAPQFIAQAITASGGTWTLRGSQWVIGQNYVYVKITRDGSNNVQWWFSSDGILWIPPSVPISFTFTVARLGIMTFSSHATAVVRGAVDFIRADV